MTLLDPDLAPPAASRPVAALLVSVGGVLGSLARYGLVELFPHDRGGWPWATLLTNVTGAFLLAALLVALAGRWPQQRYLRPLLATGVLGGYTTFSTLSVDVVELADAGHWLRAAAYVVVSITVMFAACWAGLVLARRRWPAR